LKITAARHWVIFTSQHLILHKGAQRWHSDTAFIVCAQREVNHHHITHPIDPDLVLKSAGLDYDFLRRSIVVAQQTPVLTEAGRRIDANA